MPEVAWFALCSSWAIDSYASEADLRYESSCKSFSLYVGLRLVLLEVPQHIERFIESTISRIRNCFIGFIQLMMSASTCTKIRLGALQLQQSLQTTDT